MSWLETHEKGGDPEFKRQWEAVAKMQEPKGKVLGMLLLLQRIKQEVTADSLEFLGLPLGQCEAAAASLRDGDITAGDITAFIGLPEPLVEACLNTLQREGLVAQS